jgi:DNA topoisomerase-1
LESTPRLAKLINVKDGRYGPYISDGKVNVSLKGDLSLLKGITLEQAVELINQKRLAHLLKRNLLKRNLLKRKLLRRRLLRKKNKTY